MTCSVTSGPRSIAEILDDIERGERQLRDARDEASARTIRRRLSNLGWLWTQALDAAERERIEAMYPVTL